MSESIKLALEIFEVMRKCSSKDVAEDVFGEISQIWQQNIVDEEIDEESYNEEYDLHLK